MLKFVCALLFVVQASWAKSIEESKGRVVGPPEQLLKCKPAAKKSEAAAREAAEAENLSDHESFSRLVFSESISTGYFAGKCNAPSSEALMEAIAWGIVNRVKKYSPSKDDPKPDAYAHIIYQPKQFATSFSSKPENPFAAIFLCPQSAKAYLEKSGSKEEALLLYNKAKEVGAKVMDDYQRKGIPVANARLSQFFYPHSEFAAERPAWAKGEFVNVLGAAKPCVEFYKR